MSGTVTSSSGLQAIRSNASVPIAFSYQDSQSGMKFMGAGANAGFLNPFFFCSSTGSAPCSISTLSIDSQNYAAAPWAKGKNQVNLIGQNYSTVQGATNTTEVKYFIIDDQPPKTEVNCLSSPAASGWYTGLALCGASANDKFIDGVAVGSDQVAGPSTQAGSREFYTQGGVPYSIRVLLTRPVKYWQMQSSSLADSSVNMTNQPLSNPAGSGITFSSGSTPPTGGGSWDFTGSAEALKPTTAYGQEKWASTSVSAWVRPTATTSQAVIAEQVGCFNQIEGETFPNLGGFCLDIAYSLRLNADSSLTFFGYRSSGSTPGTLWSCSTDANKVSSNAWNFVTATRQAQSSSANGKITIYVNGVEVKSCSNSFGETGLSESKVEIGRSFKGQISQVSLVNGALSKEEVVSMYIAGCSSESVLCPRSDDLLFFPLEGETTIGMKAKDRLGNTASLQSGSVKADRTQPTVNMPSCSGTMGSGGWFISDASCALVAADNISRPDPATLGIRTRLSGGSYGSLEKPASPEGRTRWNLVRNPRGLAGVSGWSASAGSLIVSAYNNDPMLSILEIPSTTPDKSYAVTLFGLVIPRDVRSGGEARTSVSVLSGRRYVCSAWVYPLYPGKIRAVWRDISTGAELPGSSGDIVTSSGSWVRVQSVWAADRTGDVHCAIRQEATDADAGSNWRPANPFTNVMVEEITAGGALPFFDGFSAGAGWFGETPSTVPSFMSAGSFGSPLTQGSVTVSQEGIVDVRPEASDKAGLSATGAPVTIQIDKTNPTNNWTGSGCSGSGSGWNGALINGWHTTNVSCQIRITDAHSGPQSFAISENAGQSWADEVNLGGTLGDFQLSEEKSYAVSVRARDKAGRTEIKGPFEFKIDKTPPTVAEKPTCFGVAGKEGWVRPPISCSYPVSDSVSGISNAYWASASAPGGNPSASSVATVSGSQATFTLNASTAKGSAEGPSVFFTGRARDNAGLFSGWQWMDSGLKIDATSPVDQTPSYSQSVANGERFRVLATDPGLSSVASGLDPESITCSWRNLTTGGGPYQSPDCTNGIEISSGSSTQVQTIRVSYSFADKAGNQATGSRDMVVDNNKPNLAEPQVSRTGWSNENVSVTLQASKSQGTAELEKILITDISYLGQPGFEAPAEEKTVTPETLSGFSGQATAVFSAEGVRTVTFVARDTAGNESLPRTVEIRIDKTPPTVQAPSSNETLPWQGLVRIGVAAQDPPIQLGSGQTQAGSGLTDARYEICPGDGCTEDWREITVENDTQVFPINRRPACGEPTEWVGGFTFCWFESSEEAPGLSVNQARAVVFDAAGNETTSPEIQGDTDNPFCLLEL